jgi:drug/metabolite transporter (DMT)-like permease
MVTSRLRIDSRRHLGLLLACLTALISGFAVFLNGYAVRAWAEVSDATTYTTMKNAIAALVLLGVMSVRSRRAGVQKLTIPRDLRSRLGLSFVAVFGGALAFVLFFEGLARATSVSAAFIHKTLIVWVAILAVGILRERVRAPHLIAIGLLVGGQAFLAGGIAELRFGAGETMILAATLIWAVEVVIVKQLLVGLSPQALGASRMAGGALVLLAYALARGALGGLAGLTLGHVGWALLTGVVLSGYVATWFAALSRAPALDVSAVLVGGALVTALLRSGVAGVALPSPAGLGLVAGGVIVAGLAGWHRRSSATAR